MYKISAQYDNIKKKREFLAYLLANVIGLEPLQATAFSQLC